MEGARRLLDTLHGAPSLEERPRKEGDGEAPDKVLVDYSMDCRRKQKMMCGQLQVLRLLLEFLLHADHASWEEDSLETLSLKEEEVKRSWKMLKAEYQEKVTETERLLPQLIQRLQRLHNKRRELEEGLQRHENKKVTTNSLLTQKTQEELQHLQGVVQNHCCSVEKCRALICQLEKELQGLERSVSSWIQTVSRDSAFCALLQTLHGVSLVSVGDNKLVLDLKPGEVGETAPLLVSLCWTSEGDLRVESAGPVPAMPLELLDGSSSHVRSVILELQSWYRSQALISRQQPDAVQESPPQRDPR